MYVCGMLSYKNIGVVEKETEKKTISQKGSSKLLFI